MRSFVLVISVLLASCERSERTATATAPAPAPAPETSPSASASPPLKPDVRPFDQVLGSYVTRFNCAGKEMPRAANIELAAKRLNGKVVDPGDEFSFNAAVGVRSKEAGFVEAPVIFKGELTPDVGGGVCQASSTVHAAALASSLKIVHRLPHSRPSVYIMAGLDATVVYSECADGGVDGGPCYSSDLVIKNTYSWPVRISAETGPVADDKKKCEIGVTFWGRDAQETKVDFRSTFSWTDDFSRRYKRHPWRKSPYRRKVQEGARGRRAFLTVTTEWPDGRKQSERSMSEYSPVDEVWEVGADWAEDGPPPWDPGDAGALEKQDSGG